MSFGYEGNDSTGGLMVMGCGDVILGKVVVIRW